MATINWPPQKARRLLSQRVDRIDGPVKVTGAAKYSYDISRPGMLYAKILYAPIAAGVLKSLDLRAAEATKGVQAIQVMAEPGTQIHWAGQEIAAVAATTEEIAKEALSKIKAVYEPGTPQMDDTDPAKGEGRERTRTEGDPDQAFREADVVAEGHYGLPPITHCCLEAHGQVAEFRDGELYVWPSTQAVSGYAGQLTSAAGLPESKIHVDCQHMGGGFGSKFSPDAWSEACVQLAKTTGKPVKLMLERDQELMIAGHRPSAYADVKIGARKDGTVTAWESKCWGSGGMGSFGAPPVPYVFAIPNTRTASQGIPVNRGSARAWRAPRHPQACLITMAAMEDAAAALGMDALEFFLKNLQHVDEELRDVYREELLIAADLIGYREKAHPRGDRTPGPIKRGLGLSVHTWGGAGHTSACDVTIHPDGSVVASVGTQDLGTGTRTVVAVVVAETLGLPLDAVQANIGRNAYPPSGASGGSTTAGGVSSSTRRASTAALNDLLEKVAPELGVAANQLEAADGTIRQIGNPSKSIPWKEACALLGQTSITQQGKHQSATRTELTSSGVGGAQIADVSVDIETGVVTVHEMAAVQDCGLVIDLKTAESQVYGGVIMGITYTLYEEAVFDRRTGRMLNADMEFYKLAGLGDVGTIKVHMMTNKWNDDRGVIGLGEPPVISPGAAISNAVANAIGVRVGTLPLSPDKVLAALAKGKGRT
jgi:xanthine dehydrogenase YagR molybdenum-binding subunit